MSTLSSLRSCGRSKNANIEYVICGALALAVHGAPRATKDIDRIAKRDDGDVAWNDGTLSVVSRDGLITLTLTAGCAQELVDIESLAAAEGGRDKT